MVTSDLEVARTYRHNHAESPLHVVSEGEDVWNEIVNVAAEKGNNQDGESCTKQKIINRFLTAKGERRSSVYMLARNLQTAVYAHAVHPPGYFYVEKLSQLIIPQ